MTAQYGMNGPEMIQDTKQMNAKGNGLPLLVAQIP
jgi:hypothetical protein